jgi:hypothetical protein
MCQNRAAPGTAEQTLNNFAQTGTNSNALNFFYQFRSALPGLRHQSSQFGSSRHNFKVRQLHFYVDFSFQQIIRLAPGHRQPPVGLGTYFHYLVSKKTYGHYYAPVFEGCLYSNPDNPDSIGLTIFANA